MGIKIATFFTNNFLRKLSYPVANEKYHDRDKKNPIVKIVKVMKKE